MGPSVLKASGWLLQSNRRRRDCSRLLHPNCLLLFCLPPPSFSWTVQFSLFYGINGFWEFLGKVAGSKDLGRRERAGQMSEPLPDLTSCHSCPLLPGGFWIYDYDSALVPGCPDKLGQMSQSRFFIYSRPPRVLFLSHSLHSPLNL